jgi:hypothetical protein
VDVYEITGFRTGIARDGVNFLEPGDSFQILQNGYIYRQVLQSRRGIGYFAPRLVGNTRILGIYEWILPDSTKRLIAFDTNFLYQYNTGTAVFDQIAFGGSMAAYAGFAIATNQGYISATSYPDKDNNARFVFCSPFINPNGAGSAIFFYDGTNVKDYTSVVDNPDYANPLGGTLTKAKYATYFGERLNFSVPTIGGIDFYQGFLYSGIRDSSGNGDKFNAPGSGLLQLDSQDVITGVAINGQFLNLKANRSDWVIEKTADAFNPYFSRKVYGVLGTNADFSAVVWDDQVKSLGKTGILTSDGRNTLRIDDKIPYFTKEEIDQIDFNLTYGGFDRNNNQFLWAFKQSGSESTTQDKVLGYNYEESTWSVYDYRVSVFGQTDLGIDLTWDQIDETSGNESWATWDTTEDIWDQIGLGEAVQKTLAGDDLGFIYQLDVDLDDNYAVISGITQASQAVISVSVPGLLVGDSVVVSNVQGMTQINNFDPNEDTDPNFVPYIVTAIGAGTITINADSTLFDAWTSGGNVSKVIAFEAKTIPFNPYRDLGRRCYISHVEFLIENNGGYLKVDVYADEEETPFKKDILLLPDSTSNKTRQWISMSVDNEANFQTFVLKQQSPNVQVKVTSIRIHAEMGGMTSG